MSDKSKIEWCDATWNPVTGCTKVSEGCRNCYAKTFTERFEGTPGHYFESGFKVTLRPEKLDQPLRWRRPRRIFVNSMSDLFHPDVPDDFIDQVFAVMALAPQHTFQVLTKRPERMLAWYNRDPADMNDALYPFRVNRWPLPNVWLGVSVENQKAADERIPLLLQTPAAIRFLSCEPLLGEVDLSKWLLTPGWVPSYYDPDNIHGYPNAEPTNEFINWVIVGGESGPRARPMHPDWVRGLRDQCQAAGVPFFFKQWGEWHQTHDLCAGQNGYLGKQWHTIDPDTSLCRIGKRAAGRTLDGQTWDKIPEVPKLWTCSHVSNTLHGTVRSRQMIGAR